MMIRLFLTATLLCAYHASFCQSEYEDSLKIIIENESVDSIKATAIFQLVDYFESRNVIKWHSYSTQAYDFSKQAAFKQGIIRGAINLGSYHRDKANYDSSIHFYRIALRECGDKHAKRANIYYHVGNVLKSKGEYVRAIDSYLTSLQIAERSENVKDVAIAQLGIGNIYLLQNETNEAALHFIKASDAFHAIEDKKGIYISANNVGTCYFHGGKYGLAKAYFLRALELAMEYNDLRGMGNIMINLSSIFIKENRYDSAMHYGLGALDIRKKFRDKEELIESYHKLAEVNVYMRNFKEAERFLDVALELTNELESTKALKFNWNYRAQLDTARGDYKTAFDALIKYYDQRNKMEEQSVKTEIEGLKAKYESDKKEAEILSLSQQTAIQALEIRQKNQVMTLGIVLFVFVLTLIYFIYNHRETKKRQSHTELEQRFLRSQLNPHFISNALVAVQSFMLKNDSKSASLYLTKFSKLMREILENSRREFIPVEEEISMLRNYMDIHQQRLGSFEYNIVLDDDINTETDTIPPMFIQPFVENAVEHGIGNMTEGGKIELKFRKEGDFITVLVNDNGNGISQVQETDQRSLSTKIIRERINLFNRTLKKKINIAVDNLKDEAGRVIGTKVELKVPFEYI